MQQTLEGHFARGQITTLVPQSPRPPSTHLHLVCGMIPFIPWEDAVHLIDFIRPQCGGSASPAAVCPQKPERKHVSRLVAAVGRCTRCLYKVGGLMSCEIVLLKRQLTEAQRSFCASGKGFSGIASPSQFDIRTYRILRDMYYISYI